MRQDIITLSACTEFEFSVSSLNMILSKWKTNQVTLVNALITMVL